MQRGLRYDGPEEDSIGEGRAVGKQDGTEQVPDCSSVLEYSSKWGLVPSEAFRGPHLSGGK